MNLDVIVHHFRIHHFMVGSIAKYLMEMTIYTVDCIFQQLSPRLGPSIFSMLALFGSKYSSSSNIQASESVSTISLLSVLALYIHASNSSLFTLSSQPPV